ncbi:hypothetical protein K503DRAFT_766694 [Rhizopogon vinicolor AM-OR11-026]|uniref:Uncharacterized protein n=1 Tax=Rhizopogon vinicolor AM-OR11-026 TaxID=1314800 RepID=A0A1B7NCD4_9AGAM|nr:hypothetical protein K503DRAFT_766694 [Rhizopogon vinicolor AM-OR11-026]
MYHTLPLSHLPHSPNIVSHYLSSRTVLFSSAALSQYCLALSFISHRLFFSHHLVVNSSHHPYRLAHTFHAPSRTVLHILSCAIVFRTVSHILAHPHLLEVQIL